MEKKLERDEKGRIKPGQGSLNPGGRPAALKEYQEWLRDNALDKAKNALLGLLVDPDGKVRIAAVKEVNDRLFGRAPLAVVGEDGKPVNFGLVMLPSEDEPGNDD